MGFSREMARRISIFGSTGSIGQQTIDLIERKAAEFNVVAISGGGNIDLLAAQAKILNPQYVITAFSEKNDELIARCSDLDVTCLAGREALLAAAMEPVDWAMSAIVGFAGLEVSLRLATHGTTLALANKESLVCGGSLLTDTCLEHGTVLLPVDSEHSAIFQTLNGEKRSEIDRVIITASGGPFRSWTREAMENVTPAQAANHPKWSMGQRISIDSATLFNKALEVIEAKEFFNFSPSQIEVIIHPQSTIHSMLGFVDQAVLAHLGVPDMRGAIGYALYYPDRKPLPVAPLDLAMLGRLDFEAPDEVKFPALRLAREVMEEGGLAGAVLNGAKEASMDAFLDGDAKFLDMADFVDRALQDPAWSKFGDAQQIDAIIAADTWSRNYVRTLTEAER